MKYYYCPLCGNLLEMIDDSGVVPVCCGELMEELVAGSDDSAASEKHVPVISNDDDSVIVKVGEVFHPMNVDHYIEWVELVTDRDVYRKRLEPGELPIVNYCICEGEKVDRVFAYCNIHGLWELVK